MALRHVPVDEVPAAPGVDEAVRGDVLACGISFPVAVRQSGALARAARGGQFNTLATCDWVKKGEPLCLIGDSGTGKSHLLIALGTEAAMLGYRVRYVLATKLVNELVEAADETQLSKTIAR